MGVCLFFCCHGGNAPVVLHEAVEVATVSDVSSVLVWTQTIYLENDAAALRPSVSGGPVT